MTPEQRQMARSLALCGLFPGSNVKRFARDMASMAIAAPETELTPAQHRYLCDMVERYRRQIPPAVVATARAQAFVGPPIPKWIKTVRQQKCGRTCYCLTQCGDVYEATDSPPPPDSKARDLFMESIDAR